MADIREYIGNEVSSVNVNLLERKILKGFYALEGDIIKIRSLYDYLLVQAETTFGDNFTNTGDDVGYTSPGSESIGSGTKVPDATTKYLMVRRGDEISGKFKSVKVIDGEALIIGRGLSEPTRNINFWQDFTAQDAISGIGGGADAGLISQWYDANQSVTTVGPGVSKWDSLTGSGYFEQSAALKRPTNPNVDLSSAGGSATAKGITFNGVSQYLIANHNSTFAPTPSTDKFTVIMAVSGDATLLGTLLDRTWHDGLADRHQLQYSAIGTGGGTVGLYRNLGNTGDQNTSFDISNRFNIIVTTGGYDSVANVWAEHLHISHTDEIDSFVYGSDTNIGIKTWMGAARTGAGLTESFHFSGNIHEVILLNNRLAESDYGDYNLNVPMIDAIGLYLKNKWVPDGGNIMWTPAQ